MRLSSLTSFCAILHLTLAVELPKWTGPYNVGVSQHVFKKETSDDPTNGNGTTVNYLATFYYPTPQKPGEPMPYIAPELAAIYENLYSYPVGSLEKLTSNVQRDAPALGRENNAPLPPSLIFGPGGVGPPTALYQAQLADLASHGYAIAALDHPHEQPYLQYPDGTGIIGLDPKYEADNAFYTAVYDFRINDTLDFVKQFPAIANAAFNTTHYVFFGHSLGGAAAVGAMMELEGNSNTTVLGAINMDGQFWGAPASNVVEEADARKPVFLFGSQGHDFTADPTWLTFPISQSGWWREVNVKGARHIDFSDIALWKKFNASTSQSIGIIKGERMTEIVSRFVRDFVGFVVGGKARVLEEESAEYPEVEFLGGS